MKALWQQALEVESMLGEEGGKACLYGSSECGEVDGQITRDTWSTRTRKRCFQGVTLLEVYSHTHTVMKRKEQKKKEVEDEMRILPTVVRKWKWRRRRGGMALKSCPQDLRHNGFIWILHDLNTGGQLSGWYGERPSKRTRPRLMVPYEVKAWSYRGNRCSQQQRSQ